MNIPCTIELFGGLRVCCGSEKITRFATQKTAALLAYLAYHVDRNHAREFLIELLWPDCETPQGRNRLNTLLSHLRRLLEPPGTSSGSMVQTDHRFVRLSPELLTTDVIAFERLLRAGQTQEGVARVNRLEEAVGLYQNGLLPGFYDEWVLLEQQRLNEKYVEALQELAWNLEKSGAWETALEMVGKILALDPYREPSYRLQMRLQTALGQPAGAQQTYQTMERLFRKDLGVAPSAATRELVEQIRRDPRAVVQPRETAISTPRENGSPSVQSSASSGATGLSAPPSRSNAPHSTHLPVGLTRFVGREAQTALLREWLLGAEKRLVTLTGPGGAGKTRLAVETAHHLREEFNGRVWFVDLAALQEGSLLPFALATALQITLSTPSDPLPELVKKLQEGPSLLILDNFEHLLRVRPRRSKEEGAVGGESALLVRLLLEQAEELKCLVTSRQPLHLGGEQELSVPALTVPAYNEAPERLIAYEGVALYVDRARAVRPEFALTEHNTEAVAALCRRLEGLPLAIEMAAAWARTLPPEKMLERLEHQLDLLVSRRRDLPARQQSLRATFEWSYGLMPPELHRCFARLSVFRGGFTVEAAEALCDQEVLEYLSELQERSLVLGEAVDEGWRYRLLESLRQYAGEKLAESGELAETNQKHAEYFLVLAEEAERHLTGAEQAVWLRSLETEHGNLRAALEWSMKAVTGGETGLRLCGALYRFWQVRGYLSEGQAWCATALSRAESQTRTTARAKALNGAGVLADSQGDYQAAHLYHEESLALFQERGDKQGVGSALNGLGAAASKQGDYSVARRYYEQSLILFREIGDRAGIASSLNNLASIASIQGDRSATRAYFSESLLLRREIGDKKGIAASLNNLGNIVGEQGDFAAARAYYEESLLLKREIGDRGGVASSLLGLGNAAHNQGDYAAAWTYYQESLSIKREIGDKRGIAHALHCLGSVAHNQGDRVAAQTCFAESLLLRRDIGDRQGIADVLEGFADLAIAQKQVARSVRFWGAANRLREEIGAPLPSNAQEEYDPILDASRQALGPAAFAEAWEEGRRMSLEQTIQTAFERG